ncbi:MAG: hypothetical protein ACYSR4_04575, partial [Planctomycetota bacterium]
VNCQKLERAIRRLEQNNNIPPAILTAYGTYHCALVHKLKSTEYYTNRLKSKLSTTTSRDVASAEFLFSVNRNIDGFFQSGGSALDILAREVLTYFAISLPQLVYFKTARQQLNQHRPRDPIINRLQDPKWKADFSNYRNALTHELLVVRAALIDLSVHVYAGTQPGPIILPLPDNPRSNISRRTYRRNPNVLQYCHTTFKRLVSLVNQVYGELTDRIVQNNRLPL